MKTFQPWKSLWRKMEQTTTRQVFRNQRVWKSRKKERRMK